MKIERALAIRNEASQSVRHIYSSAENFQLPSSEISERINKMKKNFPKGTPYWVISYLEGVESMLRDILFREKLEFCYTVEGELYSTRRESSRYYEKYFKPSELNKKQSASGFYYQDTDKPYFISYEK